LEWWSFNFRYGESQQGWHFTGAIILMAVIIPSSLLVTSFIGLWFETIKIKLFFWISIFIVPGLMFAAWIMIILMKALGLVGV
jgi:hypothetical protein